MKDHAELIKRIEEKITIRKKSSGYAALGMMILLTILLNVFLMLRGPEKMETNWSFNIGVNLMACHVCAVVFYSCLQDSAGVGERNPLFLSLLITSHLGMFLSALCWIIQDVALLAFWNRLANVLLYINNYVMLCLFWLCELFMLDISEKLKNGVNELLKWITVPALLLNISNLFIPVFFSVDAEGFYQRTAFFPAIFVMMLPLLLGITAGIITSDSSKKDKLIVASFVGLPLIVFLIGIINPDISILEPAMFFSFMIIYFMLINERGKRLTVTMTELNTAAEIQASAIPHVFPPFPERTEFDLYASMTPAREVGGDFYDYMMVDDDHLIFLIADVSDKGTPAALFMMSTKNLISYRARHGGTPAEILTDVNAHVARDNPSKMFITVWMGKLDLKTGKLTCTNAGHENPAVCGSDGVFRIFRDKHGLMIGAMEHAKYRDYELTLQPGDKIFVYTDGVPDASNNAGERYGTSRLEAALNRFSQSAPESILRDIRADVDAFADGAKQFDDLTMLCLEYRGTI